MSQDANHASRKWDARDWALAATSLALVAVVTVAAWRTYTGFQEYKVVAAEERRRWDAHEYLHSHRQPYSNRSRTNPNVFSNFG